MSDLSYIYRILEDLEDQNKPDESDHLVMGLRWINPEHSGNSLKVRDVYVSTFKGPAKAFIKVGKVVAIDKQGPRNWNKNTHNLLKRFGMLDDLVVEIGASWNDIKDVYFDLIDQAVQGSIAIDYNTDTGITIIFAPGSQLETVKNKLISVYHADVDFKRHPYREFR